MVVTAKRRTVLSATLRRPPLTTTTKIKTFIRPSAIDELDGPAERTAFDRPADPTPRDGHGASERRLGHAYRDRVHHEPPGEPPDMSDARRTPAEPRVSFDVRD